MKQLKLQLLGSLTFLGLFIASSELKADVVSYSIFEVASYHQIDETQPTNVDVPNAYFFGAQLLCDTNVNEVVTDASLTAPDTSFYNMNENIPGIFYTYNSDYFDSQADMNAAYPTGTYEFDVDSDTDSGLLNEPSSPIYSTSIPYFTGETWDNMQALDPTQPFTFTWNNFDPDPAANTAFIFIRIVDTSTFNYAFTQDFIPANTNSFTLPANSLKSGSTFQIQLLFSDRQTNTGSGFLSDALATSGFDNLTYTSLNTIAPTLTITPAGTNVVLSWPITATNYVLEGNSNFPTGFWGILFGSPTIVGNQVFQTNAISDTPLFFRLYLPQYITSIKKK